MSLRLNMKSRSKLDTSKSQKSVQSEKSWHEKNSGQDSETSEHGLRLGLSLTQSVNSKSILLELALTSAFRPDVDARAYFAGTLLAALRSALAWCTWSIIPPGAI